jgi:hypothetical protein
MDVSIKTTIYDIFGYLLPGMLSIGCIFVFYRQATEDVGLIDAFTGNLCGVNVYSCAALVGVGYLVGHFVSALSSLVLEKWMLHKLNLFGKSWDLIKILDNDTYQQLSKKYKEVFKLEANKDEKFFRNCLVYVEARQPAVYSTAFVFLSFYGMARGIALIAITSAIWAFIYIGFYSKQCVCAVYVILALLAFAGFMRQYLRFQRYFRQHILSGFLLPGEDEKGEDERDKKVEE